MYSYHTQGVIRHTYILIFDVNTHHTFSCIDTQYLYCSFMTGTNTQINEQFHSNKMHGINSVKILWLVSSSNHWWKQT